MKRSFRKTINTVFALAFAIAIGSVPSAQAATPPSAMAQVKALADQIMGVMQDPSCKADPQACREKLRGLVEGHWDVTDMARLALGVHWKELDARQREHFTKLFANLLESIYLTRANVSKAEDYAHGTKVDYLREISEGDGYSQINTNVTLPDHEKPVNVNYRLKLEGSAWKVYDVIVDGISIVGNYRTQFSRIINNKGYPALIQELEHKVQQINASQGA